jgi:site-specific recombinase XerD
MKENSELIEKFNEWLQLHGKIKNTIDTYCKHIECYISWFEETYGEVFQELYRMNILEYKSYIFNVKKLGATTVNNKTQLSQIKIKAKALKINR